MLPRECKEWNANVMHDLQFGQWVRYGAVYAPKYVKYISQKSTIDTSYLDISASRISSLQNVYLELAEHFQAYSPPKDIKLSVLQKSGFLSLGKAKGPYF